MEMIFEGNDVRQELDEQRAILESLEGQHVIEPSTLIESVKRIASYGDQQWGESLPWGCDHLIKFRSGELSVWSGVNGHGKSQALGQAMLHRMSNQKVLIASLEMKPYQTLYRMVCQYAGCRASAAFTEETLHKFDNRLWIYNQVDTVDSTRILALVHYAAKKLKVDHIVIDSLMKCGLVQDDFAAEKNFVDRLQNAAKSLGIHVHLVAHPRKGLDEKTRPTKLDVAGTGHITNIPDNVFIVWRNKAREVALKKQLRNDALSDKEQTLIDKGFDCLIAVEKNREGGKEGIIPLYFHESSGQYTRREGQSMLEQF